MDGHMISKVLAKYGVYPEKWTLIKQESNRNVWEVKGDKRKYALKSVNAEIAQKIPDISFYLSGKGIPVITPLPTLNGDFFVQKNKFFFILFPWFEGEFIRYDTPGTIERMSGLLAQFHEASRGYAAAGKLVKKKTLNLLYDYSKKYKYMKRIYKELEQSDDRIARVFSNHYSWLQKRCKWVIKRLPHTTYQALIASARLDPILGHGDYSRVNILSDKRGNWIIIDLDTVGVYLPIRDLSRMITWINHDFGNWDSARFKSILQCYRNIRPFSRSEEELLIVDQCFPHQALALITHYYKKIKNVTLLEEFERCLATDKEKLRELHINL